MRPFLLDLCQNLATFNIANNEIELLETFVQRLVRTPGKDRCHFIAAGQECGVGPVSFQTHSKDVEGCRHYVAATT
mgnify:CR=1 FL=1